MNNMAIRETDLFKLVVLVAGIVVGMFFATVLVGLVFMPNPLMMRMPSEDMAFLLPMTFATICSVVVLAFYAQSYRTRLKK